MEKFNYNLTFKQNLLFLKLLGLWPSTSCCYKLYTFFVTVFIMGVYNCFRVINIFFVYNDLKVLTATIYLTVSEVAVSIKSCIFIKNIKTINGLIETLNCEVFQPKNEKQKKLVEERMKTWTVAYRLFWGLVVTCLSMWTVSPLMVKTRELPVPAWYPYDATKSPLYEITYFYQVVSIWVLATANMNMDSFIAALMTFITSQCDILCDDLSQLEERDYQNKLIQRIVHHKKILRFAQESNVSYNFIVLTQFFTSSLVLALSMFLLTLVEPMESVPLLNYVFGMALQIFLYCWFGNEVELKSNEIPYCAFGSQWTSVPIEAKKNLVIFIMRAQKPIRMSAVGLFSLSLTTFTTILRSSWSYFAVLRQVNAKN